MGDGEPNGRMQGILALAGGACVVLGFPPFSFFPPLLILGPLLLLRALRGATPRRAALLGALFGSVVQGGGFPWLAGTVTRFYGVVPGPEQAPSPAAAFWLGIGAFLVWWLLSSFAWVLFSVGVVAGPRDRRARLLWVPLLWVAIEAFYPRIFPWALGAGFVGWGWTAQGAWLLGVEGLSAFALLLAELGARDPAEARGEGRAFLPALRGGRGLALALLLLLLIFGAWRHGGAPTGPEVTARIGYVQGGISLERRHSRSAEEQLSLLAEVVDRTRGLAGRSPDLVVWAEGILPGVRREEWFREWVRLKVGVPVAVGGLRAVRGDPRIWNRLFVALDGAGERVYGYDKVDRLAFGEYFPLRGPLTAIGVPIPAATIAAGEERGTFPVGGIAVGPSICFEGILPATALELRERGAQLHLNVTEDLWYGESGAPHQHLALTRMRAIEAGLPLLRVTNAGVSVLTDSRGRVLQRSPLGTDFADVLEVSVPESPEPRSILARTLVSLQPLSALVLLFWAIRGAQVRFRGGVKRGAD